VTPAALALEAKRLAADLGFSACGITRLKASPTAEHLAHWLDEGYHGEMRYMDRQRSVRQDPRRAWPDAVNVVVVLHNYYSGQTDNRRGFTVSRYAQGKDYHTVMWGLLDRLGAGLTGVAGHGSWRSYSDAGPLPERELAQLAGLGWLAKNTMLIRPGLGSYTFIGCLLTDLRLEPDSPFEADRCGSCTRCLEACPTAAFPAPRVLDATRCISYLTIESRSDVPPALRSLVGDNLFGCDICQEVCPWNVRFAVETAEPAFRADPDRPWPTLDEILDMDGPAFAARFGDTALERAGVEGLQRNARVVRENSERNKAGARSGSTKRRGGRVADPPHGK